MADHFQDGEQVLLIDQRGKRHLIFLRKGDTFHSDRGFIVHDSIIGQPDGSWHRSSRGMAAEIHSALVSPQRSATHPSAVTPRPPAPMAKPTIIPDAIPGLRGI